MVGRFFPHISMRASVQVSALTASIGLLGGITLQASKHSLVAVMPLLIALPALNAMAGDYATLINAHIADPASTIADKKKLRLALLVCVPISAAGVIVLSLLLAQQQGYTLHPAFVIRYALFVICSFILVIAATLWSSVALNKALTKHRINSDDVLIPISNVLASVIMLLCISFAAWRLF